MTKDIAKPYDIGFGKPPKKTRFKKGQSGNPAGRPRGSKNTPKLLSDESLSKIILYEAYREIRINEESGPITVPIAQAVIRSITVKAAKGDHRSQRLLTDMLKKVEERENTRHLQMMEAAVDYINDADFELERRERLGTTGPDIVPHPDDIRFKEDTGLPYLLGPATFAQKREFEEICKSIELLCESSAWAKKALEDETDEEERVRLQRRIKNWDKTIKGLDAQIHGWRPKN
jgi:hypothetical protein